VAAARREERYRQLSTARPRSAGATPSPATLRRQRNRRIARLATTPPVERPAEPNPQRVLNMRAPAPEHRKPVWKLVAESISLKRRLNLIVILGERSVRLAVKTANTAGVVRCNRSPLQKNSMPDRIERSSAVTEQPTARTQRSSFIAPSWIYSSGFLAVVSIVGWPFSTVKPNPAWRTHSSVPHRHSCRRSAPHAKVSRRVSNGTDECVRHVEIGARDKLLSHGVPVPREMISLRFWRIAGRCLARPVERPTALRGSPETLAVESGP